MTWFPVAALSRRAVVQGLAVSALTILSTASALAQDKQINLTLWAGNYTPSRLLPTNNNPDAPPIKGIDPVSACVVTAS